MNQKNKSNDPSENVNEKQKWCIYVYKVYKRKYPQIRYKYKTR